VVISAVQPDDHDPHGLSELTDEEYDAAVDTDAFYRPPEPPADPREAPMVVLESHYSADMDALSSAADSRNVGLGVVADAYTAIVTGRQHLTSHEEVIDATGAGYHDSRQAAAALSDVDDIHECYDEDWNLWWVRCDSFIKDKCAERRISLHRYYKMQDVLTAFQQKALEWYVRRNRRQQQPFRLTQLKEDYVRKIQERYFPDKPVGEEWSRHIAARYVRTAQDSMIRSYDLTY